jgi:hypothetical protein
MYWICIICGCLTGGEAEAGCGGGGSREMQILGGGEMQWRRGRGKGICLREGEDKIITTNLNGDGDGEDTAEDHDGAKSSSNGDEQAGRSHTGKARRLLEEKLRETYYYTTRDAKAWPPSRPLRQGRRRREGGGRRWRDLGDEAEASRNPPRRSSLVLVP